MSSSLQTFLVRHDEEKKECEQLFEVKRGRELVGHITRRGSNWYCHVGSQLPQDAYNLGHARSGKQEALDVLTLELDALADRSKVN